MLTRLNRWITKTTGVRLLRRAPHGLDPITDLRKYCADVRTIVDVGANTGQSAIEYRREFPAATIHSVEPVQASFDLLTQAVRGADVHCHHLAITDHRGSLTMAVHTSSQKSQVARGDAAAAGEPVECTTLAEFFDRARIDRAELVKTDTEGHEMEVLAGAVPLLAAGRIDFMIIEVGLTDDSERHVPLERITGVLRPHGMRLLGLYGQRPTPRPPYYVKYANALFARG